MHPEPFRLDQSIQKVPIYSFVPVGPLDFKSVSTKSRYRPLRIENGVSKRWNGRATSNSTGIRACGSILSVPPPVENRNPHARFRKTLDVDLMPACGRDLKRVLGAAPSESKLPIEIAADGDQRPVLHALGG